MSWQAVLVLPVVGIAWAQAAEPVTFEFLRKSGPAPGLRQAYDANKEAYYLHIHDIARFAVKAVAADIETRPVVLMVSGMLDRPEGPLTLHIMPADGKNVEYRLDHRDFDKELFRIERQDGVTRIEFLQRGKRLLQPGAKFQYIDFFR